MHLRRSTDTAATGLADATMSIAVLLASSRSDGNTRTLVDLALGSRSFAFEDLRTLRIGHYVYDEGNDADDFMPLIERLAGHDTWVIATPLYWYTMSAHAKVFIDRLADLLTRHKDAGRRLRGKRLAVMCSGTDKAAPGAFAEPFVLTASYLGMEFRGVHYAQFRDSLPVLPTAAIDAHAFVDAVACP